MSNCDVGSGGFGLPGDVVAQHGVEGSEKTTVYARHLPPSREMAINLQTFGSED